MKKTVSLSLLSLKLGFLLCLGIMGTSFGADLVFAEVPPCHMDNQMAEEPEGCDACEIAEGAWSQDFIAANIDLDLEDVADAVTITFQDLFSQEQVAIMWLSAPDPPDRIAILHSHLIFQQGIVLVI